MRRELAIALKVVAKARRMGFDAGLSPSRSSIPSPTQHVNIRHSNGSVHVRVSDHKRPPSAIEKYGHSIEFINMREREALGRIEAYLKNCTPVEGVTPPLIPDWFCRPPLTQVAA